MFRCLARSTLGRLPRIVEAGAASFVAGALSCSSQPAPSDDIVVATVTRCTHAEPPAVQSELPFAGRRKEFFSKHPLAQLRFQGGRILHSPKIVAVFFQPDPMQHATEALLESYGCTTYWRDAVGEYGVGDALYERSVVLPELPATASASGPDASALDPFRTWVSDRAAEGVFGALSEDHVLLFFLPPNTRLAADDCSAQTGAHGFFVAKDNKQIAYAFIDRCPSLDGPYRLFNRTFAATHELMEMATDPDPSMPGWKTLGAGIDAPSVRPSTTSSDDEGADFCNDRAADAPDYAFSIARHYSNRRARVGRDPCDPSQTLQPIAALAQGAGPQGIDLSNGKAHIVIDIFSEDPTVTASLRVFASVWVHGVPSYVVTDDAGDGEEFVDVLRPNRTLAVHDGDAVALDLDLEINLPFFGQVTRADLTIELCADAWMASVGSTGSSPCSRSTTPIAALPPVHLPDAGTNDATSDGADDASSDGTLGDGALDESLVVDEAAITE